MSSLSSENKPQSGKTFTVIFFLIVAAAFLHRPLLEEDCSGGLNGFAAAYCGMEGRPNNSKVIFRHVDLMLQPTVLLFPLSKPIGVFTDVYGRFESSLFAMHREPLLAITDPWFGYEADTYEVSRYGVSNTLTKFFIFLLTLSYWGFITSVGVHLWNANRLGRSIVSVFFAVKLIPSLIFLLLIFF